jgi:hypothetical protein
MPFNTAIFLENLKRLFTLTTRFDPTAKKYSQYMTLK